MLKKESTQPFFDVLGATIQGASHEVKQVVLNQDAYNWWQPQVGKLPIIFALSDGHGGARHFRSDIGSQIAVTTAIKIMRLFLKTSAQSTREIQYTKHTIENILPKILIHDWVKRVLMHVAENPFNRDTLTLLANTQGAFAVNGLQDNPSIAYGATLLVVLITDDYVAFMQLGDGDILKVTNERNVSRIFPLDVNSTINETSSLCNSQAWNEYQIKVEFCKELPAMLLMSTDGYGNSYTEEKGFLQVGTDLLEMIRVNGIDTVRNNIEDWLHNTSQSGSGDDITVGLIYRNDNYETD